MSSFQIESKYLSAQITAKSKKLMQSQQPAFFSEISYSDVRQINYLTDLEQKKKHIDFPIFQFQKDFGEEAPVNDFDMLPNNMYKKIMQNGYIQQRKPPSKKKKKTKNPFEYDYEDEFINDDQAFKVKKNIEVKLENFQCLNLGIDQFYNSELYKSGLSQIQQQSKKRTNGLEMDAQQLEEIKKKIKENISITHSKMKEESQINKNQQGLLKNIDNQQKFIVKIQLLKIQEIQEAPIGQLSNFVRKQSAVKNTQKQQDYNLVQQNMIKNGIQNRSQSQDLKKNKEGHIQNKNDKGNGGVKQKDNNKKCVKQTVKGNRKNTKSLSKTKNVKKSSKIDKNLQQTPEQAQNKRQMLQNQQNGVNIGQKGHLIEDQCDIKQRQRYIGHENGDKYKKVLKQIGPSQDIGSYIELDNSIEQKGINQTDQGLRRSLNL